MIVRFEDSGDPFPLADVLDMLEARVRSLEAFAMVVIELEHLQHIDAIDAAAPLATAVTSLAEDFRDAKRAMIDWLKANGHGDED